LRGTGTRLWSAHERRVYDPGSARAEIACAVPTSLDKTSTIVSVLGNNADPDRGKNYNMPQEHWIEGIFSGTHGSSRDKAGKFYVKDWSISGRIMKLVRASKLQPRAAD
jgi:hypothetical protein